MHPIKWIRRNQQKIITVLVIVIMIAFVGGYALKQLLMRGRGGNKVVAYYGDKNRLTRNDFQRARSELSVLREGLGAERLLASGDIKSALLGQLLFPSSQLAPMVSDRIKQAMMQGQCQISQEDVNKFFMEATGQSELYWMLLNAEAEKAGCVVSNDKAKDTLKAIVPKITEGQFDAGQLVNMIIERQHVPEEKIIDIFADLLSIINYAKMVTFNEDVTGDQLRSVIGRKGEKMDVEVVAVNASFFTDAEPTEEELKGQFELYKEISAGTINDQNPYGFGYKLPARAQLEYMIVKMEDVRTLVPDPKQEEMEEFYRKNTYRFQYEEKTDPNDPESEAIPRTRNYAEVSGSIKQLMITETANRRADMIMNEAVNLTESGFAEVDIYEAGDDELKKAAGNYKAAAEKLSEKYKIKVYTGQTGMLSIDDIANDIYLGRMTLESQSQMPTHIARIIFAVDELGGSGLGRFDAPLQKMWENIGPIKSAYGSTIAMVRITDAKKASVPSGIDTSYSIKGVVVDEADQSDDDVYSVKDSVKEDHKLLKAMPVAKVRADELVKLVVEKGWDEGIEEFNKLYSKKEDDETAVAEKFQLDKLPQKARISLADLKAAELLTVGDPLVSGYMTNVTEFKKLFDAFYSLLPAGETQAVNIMSILEFKPAMCYYVVKDISRTAVTEEEYYGKKGQIAYMLDAIRSDSLGIDHFGPRNILKRMNFKSANSEERESDDGLEPDAANGES